MNVTDIQKILAKEREKQSTSISLIASENIASKAVREAASSVLTNKYAEGYPGRRYYGGCEVADEIESLCIALVKELFNCNWANVQPHSGSQANQAVFYALLEPGDTILSLSLKAGGHLTHGASVSSTSKFYKIVHYGLGENDLIDMAQVEKLAREHKPKLIITGASGYPRLWDWKRFRTIADINGSYLLADIAHTAGLVAGNVHENMINEVDVITSTTHKTLRGPRGAFIASNNTAITRKLDSAVFPGIQGGPIMNIIAAKTIAFHEAGQPEFKQYAANTLKNATILANTFLEAGSKLVTGGTDNHLMILDCTSFGMSGNEAEALLKEAHIFVSSSALLNDTSWTTASGIRIGTPYITTLGIENTQEFASILSNALKSKNMANLKEYTITTAQRLYPKFL